MDRSFSFNTLRRDVRTPESKQESQYPALHELIQPHLASFNSITGDGLLDAAVRNLESRTVLDAKGDTVTFWVEDVQLAKPMLPDKEVHSLHRFIYPAECRERGVTYAGRLSGRLCWQVSGGPMCSMSKAMGDVPVMVRSNRCHLDGATPAKLIQHHEDAEDLGGYFIVNGIEKLVRLLVVTRRNHPLAIVRPSFAKKGPLYSQYGVQMRCVRDDQTSQTVTLHYLTDGSVTLRFSYRKQEYLVPVLLVLRALLPLTDRAIFEAIVQGATSDTFLAGRVELLLRAFKRLRLYTQAECLAYLGARFAAALRHDDTLSAAEVGQALLAKLVMVHAQTPAEKVDILVHMLQKLYALVGERIAPDNPDSPMHHEILLPGHLYAAYLKEKLDEMLGALKLQLALEVRNGGSLGAFDERAMRRHLQKVPTDLGKRLTYFLATGNLVSQTGMDLQQVSGYTIVAERLNFYRYLSHFRSVHRGAFFAELKTTAVRKLQPEAWGFLCPVHTPDGAPCGLLNHLAHACRIVTRLDTDVGGLPPLLASLPGVQMLAAVPPAARATDALAVLLDGRVLAFVAADAAATVADALRRLRLDGSSGVPAELEVALVPPSAGGLFPGLYLFSGPSRLMRPVRHLGAGAPDLIGSLEQVHLDVAVFERELVPGRTSYVELAPTNMLSVVANLTPFSDFNQSPRNMYQCQMGKQTMGTPLHAWPYRADNKLYRLHTGQTPIVRPRLHDRYGFDAYPNGANAVVAVISYTGYDMEDAMILNKSAFERGFGHGTIYKTELLDLATRERRGAEGSKRFGGPAGAVGANGAVPGDTSPEEPDTTAPGVASTSTQLGAPIDVDVPTVRLGRTAVGLREPHGVDGLPQVGQVLRPDDPLATIVDEATGEVRVERYKGMEDAIVDSVKLLGDETGTAPCRRAQVVLRLPRPPVIGDKFSSRHGQKGVCSQRWPTVDMPFTESGLTPDVIINPHAFPSRMTIGMFVESMAAKAGALHGLCQDATPFVFGEDRSAVAYFGEQLRAAGYNYYGSEPMYSGIWGSEMRADIYIGLVYYQRLRHMVSDKFQVRTTGPIHNLTHQPIKGRKRAGGIRFGEMERDSLLAHGAAFLLQDRLMNCSDYTQMHACTACGGILAVVPQGRRSAPDPRPVCRDCQSSDHITVLALPYVFRYLAVELMAMNVRMRLGVEAL